MNVFFDTSVLVAAFWLEHPDHAASLDVFDHAQPIQAFCAMHSLAEFYETITTLPTRNRFDPQQTVLYIEEIRKRCALIPLSEEDYALTLENVASRGLTRGKVYDALLLRCAEKANVDAIYTWNLKRFRSINPALADKIRTP